MSTRLHDRRCPSPKAAGWWVRLFVVGVFAFYLNYIPIHLATAAHLDDMLESVAELVFHHNDHHPEHHDSDHHIPHSSADHALTVSAQGQAQKANVLVAFLLPADVLLALRHPPASPLQPIFERIRPPGESPPDPHQPRSPPLA